MKPIEPGCLALAHPATSYYKDGRVGEENPAQIVHVLHVHEEPEIWCECGGPWWKVEKQDGDYSYTCQCTLTRIDGIPDEVTNEQEVAV